MPHLYDELEAALADSGYELELEGDVLTVYGYQQRRGLARWWRRPERVAVLALSGENGRVRLLNEPRNSELFSELVSLLTP